MLFSKSVKDGEELYLIKDILIGYKTRYIKERNLFNKEHSWRLRLGIVPFDIDLFLKAYYEILSDTNILSANKIKIFDLPYNLLYTGKHLYGIDTCGYKKVQENIKKLNKQLLDSAIKEAFYDIFTLYGDYDNETVFNISQEKNMERYAKKLNKLLKK